MNKLFQWLRPSLALGVAVMGILVLGWVSSLPSLAGSAPLDGSAKTVEPSAVYPGDLITFTIVVSNSSASDVSATVLDPSPSGVSYLSGAGSGTLLISTSYFTWTGSITAHQSVTLNVYAMVQTSAPCGTIITNTAVISDGINSLERSAAFRVGTRTYMPLIMRRWPPIPSPTVLDAISNPNYTGNYNVTWQAAELAISYILQEDDNSSFSSPQEYDVGAALNKAFTDKPGGRYYYRVRGQNEWGYGEWSNVQSTLVGYYLDDFSDPASGWQIASHPLYNLGYTNGEYRIYVPIDMRCNCGSKVDTWFDQPAVLAPVQPPSGSNYCVSVDTYFASTPGWWEQHSLIFAASADLRTLYRLETNVNGDWAVSKYTDYHMPYGGIHGGDQFIIDWHGESGENARKDQGRNHLKVIVLGTAAMFYINGTALLDYATGLSDLPYLNRVGVIGGSYEITPVDSRFDNFMWSTDVNMCP